MRVIVQKYGGTSVATISRLKNAAKRIINTKKKGYRVVAVVSAPGDLTDELISEARRIDPYPVEREMDMLLSTGEQKSSALLAIAINALGSEAISLNASQVGIVTDTAHSKAKIIEIRAGKKLERLLNEDKIVIVTGFQGITPEEDITTLGRGGSDLTAVALAAVLGAQICEIYTDVEGVYTANPRLVRDAKKIDNISYDAMLELAVLGAQVMQARSIEVAKRYGVPIHVRSGFNNRRGTVISKEVPMMEDVVVSGVACDRDQVKMSIIDVQDRPGIAATLFGAISDRNINVDMIVQSSAADGKNDISFTVSKGDLKKCLDVLKIMKKNLKAENIIYDDKVAKVSIVGVGMKSHTGVASRMFSSLARKKINIEMISTSEIKISCVINQRDSAKAVRAVHQEFELGKRK